MEGDPESFDRESGQAEPDADPGTEPLDMPLMPSDRPWLVECILGLLDVIPPR